MKIFNQIKILPLLLILSVSFFYCGGPIRDTGPVGDETETDADGDGFDVGSDCDDTNANVNPGVSEDCSDEIDNNCDGTICSGDGETDDDGDGYCEDANGDGSCEDGVSLAGDCNDLDTSINPSAEDICDGVDNNCSGDELDATGTMVWYLDSDGDGYGDPTKADADCAQPQGYVSNNYDCDDDDASVSPASGDCPNPETDDVDGDGQTVEEGDCDDNDETVYAGANELCDGLDNDCDSDIDEDAVDQSLWYLDNDGDGFGVQISGLESDEIELLTTMACEQPEGYAADTSDCNDSNEAIPASEEICDDDVDNDCNGEVDENCESDKDTDGDGVPDSEDICVNDANPNQEDSDNDGIGDVCDENQDTVAGDADNDGLNNEYDYCDATDGAWFRLKIQVSSNYVTGDNCDQAINPGTRLVFIKIDNQDPFAYCLNQSFFDTKTETFTSDLDQELVKIFKTLVNILGQFVSLGFNGAYEIASVDSWDLAVSNISLAENDSSSPSSCSIDDALEGFSKSRDYEKVFCGIAQKDTDGDGLGDACDTRIAPTGMYPAGPQPSGNTKRIKKTDSK